MLEKLEIFKRINRLVRDQLKELRNHEVRDSAVEAYLGVHPAPRSSVKGGFAFSYLQESRLEASRQMDILLEKLTQMEAENLVIQA